MSLATNDDIEFFRQWWESWRSDCLANQLALEKALANLSLPVKEEVTAYTTTHTRGKRLYVLELSHGKYYVGTTRKSVRDRFLEHYKGAGSGWTRLYPPTRILVEEEPYRPFSEDATTLLWMAALGVDAVRGGTYSQVVLREEQLVEIRQSIRHESGQCFVCGAEGHFSQECTEGNK
jgi:predicted GIY-YIG superfamily endonuclease